MDAMNQETAETIVIAPPLSAPVVVREEPRKPKSPQVVAKPAYDQAGNLRYVDITPRPGNVITRVLLAEIDPVTKLCKVAIWTQPRRGRPRKPRAEEN
jgi:hypothetical protein